MRPSRKENLSKSAENGKQDALGLGPATQIGGRLRAYYETLESEPVPDRLLDLLEQLDEAERQAGNGKGGKDE